MPAQNLTDKQIVCWQHHDNGVYYLHKICISTGSFPELNPSRALLEKPPADEAQLQQFQSLQTHSSLMALPEILS